MFYHKLIKIKGKDGDRIGYWVPRLYRLAFSWHELKYVGLRFVKERLSGWTIWWVYTEDDYVQAVETLNKLKKKHEFDYKVSV